jgi:hypothetical protein
MIHVSEINDATGLADIRLLWESLWRRTRGASYFQTLDWLTLYWQRFSGSQELKVLIVSLAGRPIGILPLVVRQTETTFGPVRVLTYPLEHWGTCYGPIGPNSAATLIAAMRHLRDNRRDWDVVDLHHVDVNRVDRGRTRNAFRAAGMNCLSRPSRTAAIVDIDPDWTTYWSERPLQTRRQYHKSERQLEQLGKLEFLRFRPAERSHGNASCHEDLFDEVMSLCRVSGTESSAERAFFRETHSNAVRMAAVDLNLLQLNGRPIAAAYGYQVNGQVDIVRCGVAEKFEQDAGRVLGARMLQDGASRGDQTYRFAPQVRSFATDWQTGKLETARLTHFAPTAPKAQLLRWNRNVKNWWGTLQRATAAFSL